MVFAGIFPTDSDDYPELRDALERLKLNDGSLSYEPETSQALGFGFRCGFLGLLHMEIVRERLEREFDLDLLITAPNVAYRATTRTGEEVEVHNPAEMPRELEQVEEPYVKASVIVPKDYVGAVMELANERRGSFDHLEYLSEDRVLLLYELPLGEIVLDFYDQLKSRTRGYASFDYDLAGFRPGDLARVDILVGGEQVDALSLIIHRDAAYERGRQLVERLREEIPRQMIDVPVQAAIGSRVIARETIKARRKDVLAKCYGGDITRKRKLLEKQKKGKKRMKQVGGVEVPQEAFLAVLEPRLGSASADGPRPAPLRRTCPFCAHRCGYCDFVTVVGRRGQHARLRRRAPRGARRSSGDVLADRGRDGLPRWRHADVHRARRARAAARRVARPLAEVTVEANPETVTPDARARSSARAASPASRSARRASSRVCSTCSSGRRRPTTSGVPCTLSVMPDSTTSRSISSTASPARAPPTSTRDLAKRSRSSREHLSCYELEAKPGTRFTHAHGEELARQAEAMEGYFEQVVDTLTAAGYRWYETANFCLDGRARGRARSPRASTTSRYWQGRDYLGLGDRRRVDGRRRAHAQPARPRALRRARSRRATSLRARSSRSTHETHGRASCCCSGCASTSRSRVADVDGALDRDALGATRRRSGSSSGSANGRGEELRLTRRGRFLGGGVTAELLASIV